jgi:hypothetical protein
MPARAVRNVVMSESKRKELVYWTHRHVLLCPLLLSTDDADGSIRLTNCAVLGENGAGG